MKHKSNSKGSNARLDGILRQITNQGQSTSKGVHPQQSLCELCYAYEENEEHLFFSCSVSQKVWNMCDRWMGVSIVHHVKARANFQHFHLFDLNNRQNLVWKGMWLAIIGEIWKHRSGVIFNHKKVDAIEIFDQAQVAAWVWMKHKIPTVKFSYSDWYLSPYTCLKFL